MKSEGVTVEELKAALIAFLRKQTDLAPVMTCLERLLAQSPDKSRHAWTLIKKASEVGLPQDALELLKTKVDATQARNRPGAEQTHAQTVARPESTRESAAAPPTAVESPQPSSKPRFLETVVLPTSPRITKDVPRDTVAEPDTTVLGDSADVTQLGDDQDATRFERDKTTPETSDVTVAQPRKNATAANADATEVGSVPIEDRTLTGVDIDADEESDFDILASIRPDAGRGRSTRPSGGARGAQPNTVKDRCCAIASSSCPSSVKAAWGQCGRARTCSKWKRVTATRSWPSSFCRGFQGAPRGVHRPAARDVKAAAVRPPQYRHRLRLRPRHRH